ncbi:hypothetical protein N9043_01040 [bacterium]|nr:hypothetical protein [bacterium]
MKNINLLTCLLPVTWIVASACVNAMAGIKLTSNVSPFATVIVVVLFLVIQMTIPWSDYIIRHNKKNGYITPKFTYVGFVVASLFTVVSFWITTSAFLNTSFNTVVEKTASSYVLEQKMGVNEIKNASIKVVDQSEVDDIDIEIDSLFSKINSIKDQTAYNLAKQNTGKTIWQVTNSCTSGVYFERDKLYKSHCNEISSLNHRMRSLEIKKVSKVAAAGESKEDYKSKVKIAEDNVELSQQQNDNFTESMNTDALFDAITRGIDVNKCFNNTKKNLTCINEAKSIFEERVFYITVAIALLLLVIEIALAMTLTSYLVPMDKPRNKIETKEKPISIKKIMQSLTLKELSAIVEIPEYDNVDRDEIVALTLALCHTYDENASIPINSTRTSILNKVTNDGEYCKAILGGSKCRDSKVINNVCKNGRLQDKVFPIIDSIFIEKSGKSYCWKSEKSIKESLTGTSFYDII